jgi:RND family efflux transporter MFP subunit
MNLDVMRTSYKNLVDNTQLLSPINGIVSTRNYDSGDLYTMGRPVLIVEQIAPVKLMVNVSEQFFTKVRKGMPVDIALDVYPGEKFSGKVSLVYPTITAATHTFPVEISIPNLQNKVRPGMFARVTIDFGAQTGIVIPDRSIIKQQGSGERYVFVYKEGKAEYRTVVLGRRLDTKYECTSGVEEGDLVITTGLNRLTSGAEVELVK